MFRYALAAAALKVFSYNDVTKRLYYGLGNTLGAKRRERASIHTYVSRGNVLVDLCARSGAIHAGSTLLEIGTGWIHWYSVYLRLHHDVEITMFDMRDNRQFTALKAAFSSLSTLPGEVPKHQEMIESVDTVVCSKDFEELYDRLGLRYVVEPRGSLDQFPDHSFDCVFSFYVLEHVPRDGTVELAHDIYRVLKPGGLSIHQIGIDDHLAHYDSKASPKQYLRYSGTAWRRYFENELQYFNRLQMSDWLDVFDQVGFSFVQRMIESVDVSSLPVHPDYQHYTIEDLSCTILTIVHRKERAPQAGA